MRCIDFRYITDCITPQEALGLLKQRAEVRNSVADCWRKAIRATPPPPAGWVIRTTSFRRLCQEAVDAGFSTCEAGGPRPGGDIRRVRIAREGDWPRSRQLMIERQPGVGS